MSAGLTLAETKSRLEAACDAVVANQDRLTKADQAIGDGDHGVGMARGFKAAREALATKPAATPADLFKTVGMAIMGKSGGASGAVFGTFFIGMAKGASGDVLDAAGYAAALKEGLNGRPGEGRRQARRQDDDRWLGAGDCRCGSRRRYKRCAQQGRCWRAQGRWNRRST